MSLRTRAATLGTAATLVLLPAATAFAATIQGGPADERLRGTQAADFIDGGAGNDRLRGLAGDDTQRGGAGDDVLRTRDGEVDRVTCGGGNDRALLDRVDVITDATEGDANGSCERVRRAAPRHRAAT